MTQSLILPSGQCPTNLSLPPGATATYVDADMFDICERVREISDRLLIVLLEHSATETMSYSIMEHCDDGVARQIFKVKALDARVLDKLRELMSVPLAERYRRVEAENHRFEQADHEDAMDRLYEDMGRPMWTELEKCGFIQRGVSYPKRRPPKR